MDASGPLLETVVQAVRASTGWTSKAGIGIVGEVLGRPDWRHGPGDDAAVVGSGDESLVVCGEAILPEFVEHDPYGAGIAATSLTLSLIHI